VEPGDHRLCTNEESTGKRPAKYSTVARSFTAEVGQTYYFRTKSQNELAAPLSLVPVDPAEAQVLIESAAYSTFQVKK
jgi:hypothetical protein